MNVRISLGFLLVAGLASACATSTPPTTIAQMPAISAQMPAISAQMPAISQPDWKVGDTCVYEFRYSPKFAPGRVVYTETVTDVAGGRITASSKGDDGSANEIVMEAGGAYLLKRMSMGDGQQMEFNPPTKWLDFPLTPGKTWTEKTGITGKTFVMTDFEASYKALGWEKIKVPAGEFSVIKVVASESYVGRNTKGESFQGTGTRIVWMSPATRCIVKEDFRSSFGHWTTAHLLSHTMK